MEMVMAQSTERAVQQPTPLRLSRVFHAPRAMVFKAWTSADHVPRWFCPDTFSIPDAKVEPHVGGGFEVCMRSPTGDESWIRGRFAEITPPTRLVIDMQVHRRWRKAAVSRLYRGRLCRRTRRDQHRGGADLHADRPVGGLDG